METKSKVLTEQERLDIIRAIALEVQSNDIQPNAEGQEIVAVLQEEKATEEVVVNHGLLNAQKEDVEDEVDFLETEENVDFDSDENEVDMEMISPMMREVKENSRG
tara:strand:+ start:503 stop:820 length:318 start_codon:yes stop_codon:yes gene_type:complete